MFNDPVGYTVIYIQVTNVFHFMYLLWVSRQNAMSFEVVLWLLYFMGMKVKPEV